MARNRPGHKGWRNRLLGIDSWAPKKSKNTASACGADSPALYLIYHYIFPKTKLRDPLTIIKQVFPKITNALVRLHSPTPVLAYIGKPLPASQRVELLSEREDRESLLLRWRSNDSIKSVILVFFTTNPEFFNF